MFQLLPLQKDQKQDGLLWLEVIAIERVLGFVGGKLNHMMESHVLEDLAIEKWEWAHGAHHCKVQDKFYNWLKLFYFKAFNKFVTNMVGALHFHVVCCCFEPMLPLCFHFYRGWSLLFSPYVFCFEPMFFWGFFGLALCFGVCCQVDLHNVAH